MSNSARPAERGQKGTIVVGVDGSPGSLEALRFAVAEAKLRNARVRLVVAWQIPGVVVDALAPTLPPDPAAFEESGTAALEAALAELGDDVAGVEVQRVVRMGSAADVLVEEAVGAEMLVVGSRGHRGVANLLLGSISNRCAHHAPCPVVIVRMHAESDAAGA
jgi:nucleotide-binding universal stress UspA family protein